MDNPAVSQVKKNPGFVRRLSRAARRGRRFAEFLPCPEEKQRVDSEHHLYLTLPKTVAIEKKIIIISLSSVSAEKQLHNAFA